MFTRRQAIGTIGAAAVSLAAPAAFASGRPSVTLHKDPNCGCCTDWGKHIEAAGFPVTVINSPNVKALKRQVGVPLDLAGCHTAEVSGYIIEGHVPAAALQRLLDERPEAIGLAVAGMPAGSPGMGGEPEAYDVVLFTSTSRSVYGRFKGPEKIG